jgi:hypothetical protein
MPLTHSNVAARSLYLSRIFCFFCYSPYITYGDISVILPEMGRTSLTSVSSLLRKQESSVPSAIIPPLED